MGSGIMIFYQGAPVQTAAGTLGELLRERGVDPAKALIEHDGEVLAPGEDLEARALSDGSKVDVFMIVAGG